MIGESLAPTLIVRSRVFSRCESPFYARVSKRDGRQDTENQLAQLRAFAQAQNFTIVHEYIDHASGKRSDRVEFQRMFADAAQRQFDLVLF